MSAQWKPGDVALVDSKIDGGHVVAIRALDYWMSIDAVGRRLSIFDDHTLAVHRLVVIDPNDRASIERFRDIFDREVIKQNDDPDPRDVSPSARASAMQVALREFANPTPRIEEPQGLGAVVEDERGAMWIRTVLPSEEYDSYGKPWSNGPVRKNWQIVKPVRVLSEGVTA